MTEFHIPSLWKNHPLTPPPQWAAKLLQRGGALVMLDGFDEVSERQRPPVSQWISAQMREYPECVFIVTSRPAGFKDYVAPRPRVPLFVNRFTPQQQEKSELLVERETGEYEFPHLSFQGYFAATRLAQVQTPQAREASAALVLQNWTGAVWRETVLLYTAQLSPKALDGVIRQACKQGSEAAALADLCLKEYPRPEKIAPDLEPLMLRLKGLAQASKYQQLETYLKNGQWQEADQETYRLMITEVGKEKGQWFNREDLLNFPCEPLRAIDGLWVKYSNGCFGFSVQKNIYLSKAIGGIADGQYHEEAWTKLCHAVGWQKDGSYVSYSSFIFNTSAPQGHLPVSGRVGSRVGMLIGRCAWGYANN